MTFLNPLALYALPAALLPAVIHLFGRRRPKRVPFSAVIFLEELRAQQFRRLRLRHLLLLLLRTLAIATAVVAFARPVTRTDLGVPGAAEGQTAMVVVVDDGPGSAVRDRSCRHLDWYGQQLADVLGTMRAGDWGVLVRTSRPDMVLPFNERTLAALTTPSEWSGDGTAAIRNAARLLSRSDAASRELVIVSDLAGPPWNDLGRVEAPDGITCYALLPGEPDEGNLSVDSISTGGELARAGRQIVIQATVQNTGPEEVGDATAALWLNGRRVQQRSVSPPPGGSAIASFEVRVPDAGWIQGRVQLSDDALAMDNARWFVGYVPPETNILIVGEDVESTRRVASVFRPGQGQGPYAVQVVAPGDVTQRDASRADVFIVNESTDLDDRSVGWVRDALRSGAGALYLAGPGMDMQAANRRLLPLFSSGQFVGQAAEGMSGDAQAMPMPLTPADMMRSQEAAEPAQPSAPAFYTLARRGAADPVLDGIVGDAPASRPRFSDYAVYRSSSDRTLLNLSSGDPWLVVGRGSAGNGAIVTAGLSTAWGDLDRRGIVVPLMHRLVNRLARSRALAAEHHAAPEIRHAPPEGAGEVDLLSPDGLRRRVSLAAGASETRLELLSPLGVWRVLSDDREVDRFALNLDPRESDLTRMAPEAFRSAVGLPNLTVLGDSPSARILAARHGSELDSLLFALVIACIVAELWLMRGVMSARERGPASQLS